MISKVRKKQKERGPNRRRFFIFQSVKNGRIWLAPTWDALHAMVRLTEICSRLRISHYYNELGYVSVPDFEIRIYDEESLLAQELST